MIAFAAVVLISLTTVLLLLIGLSNQEQAYAQNQTQGTNFTQLFSTDKEFQECLEGLTPELGCAQTVNVLYEDPALLVLESGYVDAIWKGVALAQKEGYQIDAMTSYSISGPSPSSGKTVNLLVAMSK